MALAEGETVVKPFIFSKYGTNSDDDHQSKQLKIGRLAFDEVLPFPISYLFWCLDNILSFSWDCDDKIEKRCGPQRAPR